MPLISPQSSVLPGTVAWFAAASTPAGFLECNGAAISRTAYALLFAAIGTAYGAGDGSTTFNLPDLRGEFIRGHDNGRGVDTGRAIGTAQASQNLSHNHGGATGAQSVGAVPVPGTSSIGSDFVVSITTSNHSHSIASDGGTEARPRNVAMRPCIKF